MQLYAVLLLIGLVFVACAFITRNPFYGFLGNLVWAYANGVNACIISEHTFIALIGVVATLGAAVIFGFEFVFKKESND